MQTSHKPLSLSKRDVWFVLSSSFISTWWFFYDFRKLLAFSGRICIFWWHLQKPQKKPKQKPQVSVLVMTEILNQIHAQEYHESLCRDKCLNFIVQCFHFSTSHPWISWNFIQVSLPQFLSDSGSEAVAGRPVAQSGGRSDTLTWPYIFQIHADTYTDTYRKLKGISEMLHTKMHCITEHPLHAFNSNLWINI